MALSMGAQADVRQALIGNLLARIAGIVVLLPLLDWIAPENGAKKSETPHVFHLCSGVSPLNGKTVNSGSVTEAYAQNATRITKQIEMEQKQCGFSVSQ